MPKALHQEDLDRSVREFVVPVETHLRHDWTVAHALDNLRQREVRHQIIYFYVVDEDHKLLGVLPTRKLLLARPESRLGDLMNRPVISIPESATLAEAMEEFAIRRLLALPVVDDQGRLLGILDVQLYADEAVDLAEATRVQDLFQLIGLSVQQLRRGRVWPQFRARMPWLLCNIASGLACAAIAAVFHVVLRNVLMLAMFIPLVLTLSESTSMQSMTLVLQYLHGGAAVAKKVRERLATEWKTAGLLGLGSALVVGAFAMLWSGGLGAVGVIMLSLLLSISFAALLGTILPVILHRCKLDPRLAAGPVVLMIVDVATTAVYLALGTLFLV